MILMSKSETFLSLLKSAVTPEAEWRSAPFWALNGDLQPEEAYKITFGKADHTYGWRKSA